MISNEEESKALLEELATKHEVYIANIIEEECKKVAEYKKAYPIEMHIDGKRNKRYPIIYKNKIQSIIIRAFDICICRHHDKHYLKNYLQMYCLDIVVHVSFGMLVSIYAKLSYQDLKNLTSIDKKIFICSYSIEDPSALIL